MNRRVGVIITRSSVLLPQRAIRAQSGRNQGDAKRAAVEPNARCRAIGGDLAIAPSAPR
jgi:hypothetical protein